MKPKLDGREKRWTQGRHRHLAWGDVTVCAPCDITQDSRNVTLKKVEPAECDKCLRSLWTLRQWENSVLNSNATSGSLSCEYDVEKSLPLTSADTRLNLLTADKRGQNKRNPFLSEATTRSLSPTKELLKMTICRCSSCSLPAQQLHECWTAL